MVILKIIYSNIPLILVFSPEVDVLIGVVVDNACAVHYIRVVVVLPVLSVDDKRLVFCEVADSAPEQSVAPYVRPELERVHLVQLQVLVLEFVVFRRTLTRYQFGAIVLYDH